MHQAVRSALEGASGIEGVQETLAKIPDHLVGPRVWGLGF
jgi:hypothetical protein